MRRISFDDFKYCLRANLMLKNVPLTELPKLEVIQELYREHRTVENATVRILKLKEEEKNEKFRETIDIIDF